MYDILYCISLDMSKSVQKLMGINGQNSSFLCYCRFLYDMFMFTAAQLNQWSSCIHTCRSSL